MVPVGSGWFQVDQIRSTKLHFHHSHKHRGVWFPWRKLLGDDNVMCCYIHMSVLILSPSTLIQWTWTCVFQSPKSSLTLIYLHTATLLSLHLLSFDNILHSKFKFALHFPQFEADINKMVSIYAVHFDLDLILTSLWIHQLLNGQRNILTCPFNDKKISCFSAASASTSMSPFLQVHFD